jgi:hypothetical protein
MNKGTCNTYGACAVKSAMLNKSFSSPNEAWGKVAFVLFDSESSQEKGCPKNTFLGLCEEGLIKGFSKGTYTKSIKNKDYALKAIAILKKPNNTEVTPSELWKKLNLGDKKHNSQMDVVLALWENDLIVK